MPYSTRYLEAPLNAHPKKLIRYAEILAKGIYSKAEAARQAGYSQSVAHKLAWRWIGDTRQESEMPVLFDYYEKLRKKNLREFDITAETISRELALIGFSDISKFTEMPSKDFYQKSLIAKNTDKALKQLGKSSYEKLSLEDQKLVDHYNSLSEDAKIELMIWKEYKAGSIRLKHADEIPASLMPCIAEICETREGLKIKLHDKIAALDKLAKWQRMYDDRVEDLAKSTVKEINITVNGSKSTIKVDEASSE